MQKNNNNLHMDGFLKPGGALDQGLISCFQNASQTLISSRPNPTKKLEENPVPLPKEWLPFPPTPVLVFFFFFLQPQSKKPC